MRRKLKVLTNISFTVLVASKASISSLQRSRLGSFNDSEVLEELLIVNVEEVFASEKIQIFNMSSERSTRFSKDSYFHYR